MTCIQFWYEADLLYEQIVDIVYFKQKPFLMNIIITQIEDTNLSPRHSICVDVRLD